MASLEINGKNICDLRFSYGDISFWTPRTGEALKEDIDAHSTGIQSYHDDLSQMEEDLTANTFEGFIDASFMNIVDWIYVFCPDSRVPRDLVNLDNMVFDGVLVRGEWLYLS